MSSNPALNDGWLVGFFFYLVLSCFRCIFWDLYKQGFWIFCGRFCPWVLGEVGLDGVNVVKAKQNQANVDNNVEVCHF